jgi:FkbM family methyltransferase
MYEVPERAVLTAEIDKARDFGRTFVFVDVGANVGLFSLFVASCAGEKVKILAVEPEPENLSRLRFNVAANPDVSIRVIPLALSDKAGCVRLEPDHRDKGGTHTRAWSRDDPAGTLYAECRPLLEVLEVERITAIDALKIDVEGAEDTILIPFFADAGESLWPS